MGFSIGVIFMFITIVIYTLSPYTFAADAPHTPRLTTRQLRRLRAQSQPLIPYQYDPSNLINIYLIIYYKL